MISSLLLGALAGGVTGAAGAIVAAACQHGARRLRNRLLIGRGEAAVKDVVWRPLFVPLGAVGVIAGAVAGAVSRDPWIAAAAGALLPTVVALTSASILLQARRRPTP